MRALGAGPVAGGRLGEQVGDELAQFDRVAGIEAARHGGRADFAGLDGQRVRHSVHPHAARQAAVVVGHAFAGRALLPRRRPARCPGMAVRHFGHLPSGVSLYSRTR